jgi:hypothetical protein
MAACWLVSCGTGVTLCMLLLSQLLAPLLLRLPCCLFCTFVAAHLLHCHRLATHVCHICCCCRQHYLPSATYIQALVKAIESATKTVLAEKKVWPDMDKREALVKQMLRRRHDKWAASPDNMEEHNRMKEERSKRRAEAADKRASDEQQKKRMRLEAAAVAAAAAAEAAA